VKKAADTRNRSEIESKGMEAFNPANPVPQQQEAGQLTAQGLTPNDPSRPVTQQRTAAEVRAQGLEPENPQNPVPAQRQRIEEGQQMPPAEAHKEYRALRDAERSLTELQGFDPKKVEQWVGVFRNPKARFDNLIADMSRPGSGDPERERWAAAVGDLAYHLNRPETGANFTKDEKGWVSTFTTTGEEWSYTGYKAKVDRLGKLLPLRAEDAYKRASQTKEQLRQEHEGKTPTGSAAPTTQGQAAPASQGSARQRVEQRLREQGRIK
jgi:hypothetical protein